MVSKIKKRVGIFLLIVLSLNLVFSVNAVKESYCAQVFINNINPSSVGIDEEFTVGILIENCGEEVPEYAIFELKDVSPYISVKEPFRKDIGGLSYANSNRFLVYHMRTSKDAKPGTYNFNYVLSYGKNNSLFKKEGNFSVTVTGDKAELNIASVKTKPILPKNGETIELTLRIENFGKGSANSVKIEIDYPFKGTKESFIGTLKADEDGPAVFTFISDKEGEFNIPVKISYKDDFGEHVINTSIKIIILRKDSNIWKILLVSLLIIFFLIAIFYLFRKNRRKEEIIKQLLNESSQAKRPLRKK